ncbi:sugar transferase [Aquicoccus sp. SCR17]|nr:sugar transferase [Carideicomes alvinocaridis]
MTAYFRDLALEQDAASLSQSEPSDPTGSIRPRRGVYRNRGKVFLDILLVTISLPVLLPVIAILALLVSLDGGAPFYRQRRLGRNGRVFQMLKLRTMVPDAEAQLEACLARDPEARREWKSKQKLCHDPRITRLGVILRRTSLDELPQIWNVLKGDMSLIGPRPMMVDQEGLYPGRAYYALRPGITGLWQVFGRNGTSFAERARFDDAYDASLSLGTDLRVLVRTVWVVLRCTGY